MLFKTVTRWVFACVVCAALLIGQGCTVKFKASEVEYEGQATQVYKFDGWALFDGEDSYY